ncbi:MAG: hypothetical protein R3330_06730, partial [Saprospiraceae bacterium]|nr:hypothetical protein [Saprospiraceae bacterium]
MMSTTDPDKTTRTSARKLQARPVNHFHRGDTPSWQAVRLPRNNLQSYLTKTLDLNMPAAGKIARGITSSKLRTVREACTIQGIRKSDIDVFRRRVLLPGDRRFAIVDVTPAEGYLWDNAPPRLVVEIANPGRCDLSFVTATVMWAGKPFKVEQLIRKGDIKRGRLILACNDSQVLPAGPAAFHIEVYDSSGGKSSFQRTCAVLPANPLSMTLSARRYFVTGTSSARGHYDFASDSFITAITLRIFNGDASAVTMNRAFTWEFWDGGVGGTLVESGSGSWGSTPNVAAFGSWSGNITFTSPDGSGVYERYIDKEDLTLRIRMTASTGRVIEDTIACRVMVGYGVDIIRVASDSFVGQEYTDLYDAVDVCEDIYEDRNITIYSIGRYHIDDADAGSYGIINSENECRDMWSDWSADSDGDNIDVFVCHDFSGTGFDGLAGDIPGPDSHSGRKSGVAVDKTGYVDSSGVRRLSVDYLGMLIGHEVGHYLGLEHLSVSGNLMHPSSGTYDTDLTYDQYRDTLGHDWLFV